MADDTTSVDRSDEAPTEAVTNGSPTEYVHAASRPGYVGIGVDDGLPESVLRELPVLEAPSE